MYVTALNDVKKLLGGEGFPLCQSPSLRLNKFVRLGDKMKGEEISAVVQCHSKHSMLIPAVFSEGALRSKNAVSFPATLEGNLIVNQAGGILENAGLCLHPHFGTPYIPGSAVKGVARHAAWCVWNEEQDEKKKLAIANEIAAIFGYPTNDDGLDKYLANRGWKDKITSGAVCFMPAVADTAVKLVVDIVNCHHPDYYAGNVDTAYDNESPNPQFFPAVAKGGKFRFTLFPIKGCGEEYLELAKGWLLKAITTNGVGAKTASGYGWFSYDPEEAKREEDRRIKQEAEARQKAEALAREEEEKRKTQEKAAKRASMTSEDYRDEVLSRWNGKKPKQIYKSGDVTQFDKQPDNTKKGIVLALQMSEGIGADVWKDLKSGQKGDVAKGEQAIRKYCKDNNMGKMP